MRSHKPGLDGDPVSRGGLVDQLAMITEKILETKNSIPYYRNSGLMGALFCVLYQGGNEAARKIIEEDCRKSNRNYEYVKILWRNTVLNYLFAETGR